MVDSFFNHFFIDNNNNIYCLWGDNMKKGMIILTSEIIPITLFSVLFQLLVGIISENSIILVDRVYIFYLICIISFISLNMLILNQLYIFKVKDILLYSLFIIAIISLIGLFIAFYHRIFINTDQLLYFLIFPKLGILISIEYGFHALVIIIIVVDLIYKLILFMGEEFK